MSGTRGSKAARRARRDQQAPRPHERTNAHAANPASKPLNLVGRAHPAMTRSSALVEVVEGAVATLACRMWRALRAKNGMALAACQVGFPLSLVVTHDGHAWINPQVRPIGDEVELALEGCLTLPGRWYMVERSLEVEVVATRIGGLSDRGVFQVSTQGDGAGHEARVWRERELVARMWQHEADHLRGKLISASWPEGRAATDRLPAGAEARLARHAARLG